jgi:hypothetical protein
VSWTALLRAAVAPLLATALGVTALGLVAPAAAAAPPERLPVLAAPGDDDVTDPDRPVRIEVGRFEPRTLTPGSTIRVTGTLVNPGDAAISDLGIRLQRGDLLTTRAELAANTADPDPATSVQPDFEALPGELGPGGELEFDYEIPAAELQFAADGVYPVLLNVNGSVDGEQRRVGELSSYVIQQSVLPAVRTTVTWLWPLTERSHRDASGRFVDDGLAEVVDEGGRLDRALSVVERLPGASGAAQDADAAASVALAIDPALIQELSVMAAGPYDVGGEDGTGTAAAAEFLERLRAAAERHPVVALPYGDVDLDALDAAGLPGVLVRSLPGTPAATEGPDSAPDDGTPAAPTAPAGAEGGTDEDDALPAGAGARILTQALGVEPRTDLAWPASGIARTGTLATLSAAGIDRVVLSTAVLSGGGVVAGIEGATAAARAQATTPGGPLDVLAADATLGTVAGGAETAPGGPRLAEQRFLAELALVTLQAPAGSTPTVLVAPPRAVDAGPDGVAAMIADSAGLPWLRPGTLPALLGLPAVDAGTVAEPRDAVLLDPAGLADVTEAVATRDDLAGAIAGDPGTALQAQDAAIARTTSVAWRDDPEGFRAAARDLRTTLDGLRQRVTLLSPADGTYSLASSDAPLVLTVSNELPFAVVVLLDVQVRGSRGLSIGDIGPQTLAPGERTTLQVPTEVRQSGGFAVTAQLTTPGGGPLGQPVDLQVKSTAYGPISLTITIGAAALLGLLFLRRLVLFVLRRRRAATEPAVEGAGAPQPPTRSPV